MAADERRLAKQLPKSMQSFIERATLKFIEGGSTAMTPMVLNRATFAYCRRLAIKMTEDGMPKVIYTPLGTEIVELIAQSKSLLSISMLNNSFSPRICEKIKTTVMEAANSKDRRPDQGRKTSGAPTNLRTLTWRLA